LNFNLWKLFRSKRLYRNYLLLLRKWVKIRNGQNRKRKAIKVMDQKWDYLIILDACRYDLFKRVVDSSAGSVISGGSCTQEWLKWNFNGKFDDVIYIAGNPHFASANLVKTFGFVPFFKVVEVWDYGWDSKLKTVPPNNVTLAAFETLKKYPNKRLIIHFNQPHHPFLVDKELLQLDDGTWSKMENGLLEARKHKKRTIWDMVRFGKVPIQSVIEAYEGNLRIAMKEVTKLLNTLEGRIIITADHGNHLGEYMIFGHPPQLRTTELVRVPWFVQTNGVKKYSKRLEEDRSYQRKLETRIIRERIRKLKEAGKV
jgi:hypothetical protein